MLKHSPLFLASLIIYLANKMQEAVDVRHSRQLTRLVERMKSNQNSVDNFGDTVTIKRPRDGADDDQEPSARTDQARGNYCNLRWSVNELTSANQEFEKGVLDEQAEERSLSSCLVSTPNGTTFLPRYAWNTSCTAVLSMVQVGLKNMAKRQGLESHFDELNRHHWTSPLL
ncbi:hypothetical protein Tco_0266818 [Tanacetum coccineum]